MLAAAEDWIVADLARVLGERVKTVESAPGRWSDEFVKRMVRALPAVYVVWGSGTAENTTYLDLDTRWYVYVVTGRDGLDQRARRRGTDAQTGAYALVEVVATTLHNAFIPDVGKLAVERAENLYAGGLEGKALALYAVTLKLGLQLDPEDAVSDLDEFLTAGIGWDVAEDRAGEEATDVVRVRDMA